MFRNNNTNRNNPIRDRFIPLRLGITNVPSIEIKDFMDLSCEKFTNFTKLRYKALNYQKMLKSVLMPSESKVLNFFPPNANDNSMESSENPKWPVKRSRRPVLGVPKLILDLPQFELNFCDNSADWGDSNNLIMIFTGEVYMWVGPNATSIRVQGIRSHISGRAQFCVKWNTSGTHFAVSLSPNQLGIYDVESKKVVHRNACCQYCCVTSIEWLNDDFLLTGCSLGALKARSFDLSLLNRIDRAHDRAIITIKASCKGHFAASSSLDRTVKIWNLPAITLLYTIQLQTVVCRSLAWHPWRESIIVTGCKTRFLIWNVNGDRNGRMFATEYKVLNTTKCNINAVTFNPISAELVVSGYVSIHEGFGMITVHREHLEAPVEELYTKNEKILYLLWGDRGKTLAAVGLGENLYLWDFFGPERKKEKLFLKKNVKYTTNSLDNMNAFNTYLR